MHRVVRAYVDLALIGGQLAVFSNHRPDGIARRDCVQTTADSRCTRTGRSGSRNGSGKHVEIGKGIHVDSVRRGDGNFLANGRRGEIGQRLGGFLAILVKDGALMFVDIASHVDADAQLAGRAQRTTDLADGDFARRVHVEFIGEGDLASLPHRSGGGIGRVDHRYAAGQTVARLRAAGNAARDRFDVVVGHGAVVQQIHDLQHIIRGKVELQAGFAGVLLVLAVRNINVDKPLIFLRSVDRENLVPTEGELIVLRRDLLANRVNSQALSVDHIRRANAGIQVVLCIKHCERSADADGLAASLQRASAQSQLGLVAALNVYVAGAGCVDVDLRSALCVSARIRMRNNHSHRTSKSNLAASTADGTRQRLRCDQPRICTVHVLRRIGVNHNISFVRCVQRAADAAFGLVVVDGHSHACGNVVVPNRQHSHRRARTSCTEVSTVLSVHFSIAGGKATVHRRNALMIGNVHTDRSRNVHALFFRVRVNRRACRTVAVARKRVVRFLAVFRFRKCDVQLLNQHATQRQVGVGRRSKTTASLGVNSIDSLGINAAAGRLGGHIGKINDGAQLGEIAIQVRTRHNSQRIYVVLVRSERVNQRGAGDGSGAVQGSQNVGGYDVQRNAHADGGHFAHGKAGGIRGRLSALIGLHNEIAQLFAFNGSRSFEISIENVPASERQHTAGSHFGVRLVGNHVQGNGGVRGDVVGRAVVGVLDHLRRAERRGRYRNLLLHANRILTGNRNGVDVVLQRGIHRQRQRREIAVLADDGFGGNVRVAHGKGSSNTNGDSRLVFLDDVLVGCTVGNGRSRSRSIHLLRSIADNDHDAVGVNVIAAGYFAAIGKTSVRLSVNIGHSRTAGNANIGRALAGNGDGADFQANAVQLAGITEFLRECNGEQLAQTGNGHLRVELEFIELLLERLVRGAVARDQVNEELRIAEHIGEFAKNRIHHVRG